MKIDRQKVYEKYDKHCAYCGVLLTDIKQMQVDHIIPKCLFHYFREAEGKDNFEMLNYLRRTRGMPTLKSEELETIINLNPSCRRCNHYKRSHTLEQFRGVMLTIHERIRQDYICKVAEDFGIITVKEFSGKFYFEK